MNNTQENLKIIKKAFEDIKGAIESKGISIPECTSVSEYASFIEKFLKK